MANTDLRQLMLDAEQQSTEISSMGAALPRLDRNLRQVCEASRDLWTRLSQTVPSQGTEAHLLLGSKGVDLSQLSQKLDKLSSRDMLAPIEPTPDTDIDSFIMNETQNALLNIIEESRVDNFGKVEEAEETMLDEAWLKEKEDCLNLLIEESAEGDMTMYETMETTVMAEAPSSARSLMGSMETSYAARVMEYNKASLAGTPRDTLVQIFKQLSLQLPDKKIPDLWDCLATMMHMPVQLSLLTGDVIKCRNSPQVQAALIKQARTFLQDRYKVYMQSVVASNLHVARPGGVPGTFPLVRSFTAVQESSNILATEDGLVDSQPVWALIYFCLRCGDNKAALYCAQQAGLQLSNLCPIFEELSANGELSERSVDSIRFQYRRGIANSTDLFKRVVFCLLGACDVREEYPEVVQTADDYLWFKLGQIRISKDSEGEVSDLPADMLTYNHLQSLIVLEYGETHYHAAEQPYLYAQLLILTGQFEAAIEFLSRTSTLRPHAVHMALALAEGGLLGVPNTVQTPLLSSEESDASPSKRLNMARLVMTYCRKFEHTNLREVLHYYFFLREMTGPDGINLFKLCCCDLALETSAFSTILGSLSEDATRLSGLIDLFYPSMEECKNVIKMVAEECEKKSLLEDAITIYELCGDHEGALRILSSMLGQVLSLQSLPGSPRDRLASVAATLSRRYQGKHLNCPTSTANNFNLLCQLLHFFDFYHTQDFAAAMNVISKTDLLPTKEADVEKYTKAFRHLDDSVMRNFPDILLATMNMLCAEFSKHKSVVGGRDVTARDQVLDSLRKQGQAVTAFSATLPYNMPGDTNSKLVQLMMNMT